MESNTKFAIGCLVQWYEIDIIKEYTESLKDAIKSYDGEVLVDMVLVLNQELEKTTLSQSEFDEIERRIFDMFHDIRRVNDNCLVLVNSTKSLFTIADYRREFNDKHCTNADVLIWGESDMLVPKQMFTSLDVLHQSQSSSTPKYLATFGICKMWDESWEPLEHIEFTSKPFIENDYDNWWSLKYTMPIDEMNQFNDSVEDLDVRVTNKHKFNGCGLVISSEVIKAGVNIPKSVFFVHEDTAFMLMTQKVLGNIPQYIFKNILVVHNRNHPKKREYVLGESGDTLNKKRRSNDWYVKANTYSEQNCYNIFNTDYKSKTWEDVWK
jgi:hypothetical protein